jgi:hypothetical protein
MSDLPERVIQFLGESGFDTIRSTGPFLAISQNATMLIFVADAGKSLQGAVNNVAAVLAQPFCSKRFGPKTMEMYCILLANEKVPLTEVERSEQDIRICRKVVIRTADEIATRLSFLRPIAETLSETSDVREVFRRELNERLSSAEVRFIDALAQTRIPPEQLLSSIP